MKMLSTMLRQLQLLKSARPICNATMAASTRFSSTSGGAGKLYEFRTYTIKPGDTAQFLKVSPDPLEVRFQHSKCIGYWFSEIGGLNELHHLWEYDGYQHRANVRKSLAADPGWASKAKPMIDLFQSQTNLSARTYPWSDIKETVEAGGAFFYYKLVYDNQVSSEEVEGSVKQFIDENKINSLGVLVEEVGPNTNQTVHCLVHAAGLESADSPVFISKEKWDDLRSLTLQIHSRILSPTPWSPMK